MTTLARWFPSIDVSDTVRPRVFCFPAAGGNTAMFYRWRADLADHLQVVPAELPGHRNRLDEPLYHSVYPLIDELVPVLGKAVDTPYVLLGTSMGALIAFEAARGLAQAGTPPVRLVVACCAAPRTRRTTTVHRLPDTQFLDELRRMRATPAEVLASPDLTALLLPAWRADFTLVETYRYRPGARLAVPVLAVAARDDTYAPAADVERWGEDTDAAFDLVTVDAGHFFFLDGGSPVLPDLLARLPLTGHEGSVPH